MFAGRVTPLNGMAAQAVGPAVVDRQSKE